MTVVEFGYPYRPTDAAAEIMPAVLRPEQMAIAAIGEGQSGSEVFVHEVLKCTAVELVCAGLGDQVEHAATHLSIFGSEVGGLHGDLL